MGLLFYLTWVNSSLHAYTVNGSLLQAQSLMDYGMELPDIDHIKHCICNNYSPWSLAFLS
jgi:hypothetical protein